MATKPTEHILLFSVDAWGHIGPLCGLAARIIQIQQIHVTFLATPVYVDKIKKEISRHITKGNEDLQSLVRVIGLELSHEDTNMAEVWKGFKAFGDAYEQLVKEQPLVCSVTQTRFDALPAPRSIILDMFCADPIKNVRDRSGNSVKLYLWHPACASFLLPLAAPKAFGGRGDWRPQVHAEVLRSGKDIKVVAEEILFKPRGEIFRIAGLPPIYDYELQPQDLLTDVFSGLDLCDGIILNTSEEFERTPISSIRKWFKQDEKTVYTVGPLLPVENPGLKAENNLSKDSEIQQFMNSILKSHGKESLLYISFGSFFWSTEPDKIWAFLDIVMEQNIPFIMSHGSPWAVVPDEVKAKVEKYGQGILSPWSPQQAILAHPVTGWFVSHGGQNSTLEAITSGVPMILWPYHADQPLNAIHLTENFDAGYELIEVRTSHGLKPRCRTGTAPIGTIEAVRTEATQVLTDAFGAGGARKRANMKTLHRRVIAGWDDNGVSKVDLDKFVRALVAPSSVVE
ncbi:UDP-Glycosyltransferase/glycogen phosphorylase [Abortiporus biennis]|nr:UDP-Glycosyltransferase/glycogen phosphorylase [Abortiporus biennis]